MKCMKKSEGACYRYWHKAVFDNRKGITMYYRVETFDNEKEQTVAGFVSTAFGMLYKMLGIKPNDSAEDLYTALEKTDNENAKMLFNKLTILGTLEKPDIYIDDKEENYCFYTPDEFDAVLGEIKDLDLIIQEESNGRFELIYREIDLPDDIFLYEDDDQVVISKADYEKYVDERMFLQVNVEPLEDEE